jgi:hypothetical protein
MANLTTNTQAFIEEQQYSKFILTTLPTMLMPTSFYRDVSDFGSGTQLNIKTIGTATLQDVDEDTPLVYNPIETGEVSLSITEYRGDAWYVTDKLRQDGSQIDTLMSQRALEASRAIGQNFESVFLSTAANAQASGDGNAVNGHDHRLLASGSNSTMAEDDLIAMRLAFDKANIAQAGRVAIVDPVVAATFQKKMSITQSTDSSSLGRNATFQRLLESGFNNDHQFVMDLHGWSIWTSNLLASSVAGETLPSGSVVAGDVANVFMSILDDNHKPIMSAWRQQPKVESERNKDRQRDEFLTTARWGTGAQRLDTLGVIFTSPTATA